MGPSLKALCGALKKVFASLKPQLNPISFIILTGKLHQGKTALLKQGHLTHYPLDVETSAHIFYNQHGVILELGESWINQSDQLLAHTIKALNRCYRSVRISGLILCVDISELLQTETTELKEITQLHAKLLERFSRSLGYPVQKSLILTKLDALVGFCDFFHGDHPNDLNKPLGFSLTPTQQRNKLIDHYWEKFDQMIEVLGQKIINKLHPARSSVKRTLIREFPLQLTHLRVPIQSLIQHLSLRGLYLQTIYFTSAEQGGLSIDRLNKKIQHEYALTIQDKFPQSNNYRPYFIQGALRTFQAQTKRFTPRTSHIHKYLMGTTISIAGMSLAWILHQHMRISTLLDEASKELITYETIQNQSNDNAFALYHLSLASRKLQDIPNSVLSLTAIEQLKDQLSHNTQQRLYDDFLPSLLRGIETMILDASQSQYARYQALKIYLMLGEPEHYSEQDVMKWFSHYWTVHEPKNVQHRMALLHNALRKPMQPIAINRPFITDARNYLNALPATYLFYSLAKNDFPIKNHPLVFEGFELGSKELPFIYTKSGFNEVITALPQIATKLQHENWVLARQDLDNLTAQLEQAYCFDYVSWWQNFIRRTQPVHYQNYQQGRELAQTLYQHHTVKKLIELIQKETAPEINHHSELFNQKIANEFTNLNLLSNTSVYELMENINELGKFLTTLSLVNDHGRTIFDLTKARFQNASTSDPLKHLYSKAKQLPAPLDSWMKQVADDTWFIFINESKQYLNEQWKHKVYSVYQSLIADRYPLDPSQSHEVTLTDFDHFFAPHGILNTFVTNYLKPFLDTTTPQWQPKEINGYVMPISSDLVNALIRGNIITNMFFLSGSETSKIKFSLQKIDLDPVVAKLYLSIGKKTLHDNQDSESFTEFSWPNHNAKLRIESIDGNHFELEEKGPWAFFKILQKVNVFIDHEDSTNLEILFEVNGNSGRYLLKTQNPINPFSPGILASFALKEQLS